MPHFRSHGIEIAYNSVIFILAIFNMWLVWLDYHGDIVLYGDTISHLIATILWIIFASDYAIELITAPLKRRFLLMSTFDLIALIPSHPIFVVFRIPRLIRILRYYGLFKAIGISSKIRNKFNQIFYKSGLIYLISISLLILIIASLCFEFFEGHPFHDSFWWALNTVTGIGGYLPPKTLGGKIDASFLMLGGVGFISLTTSVLTNLFTTTREDRQKHVMHQQIQDMHQSVSNIDTKLDTILSDFHELQRSDRKKNRKIHKLERKIHHKQYK